MKKSTLLLIVVGILVLLPAAGGADKATLVGIYSTENIKFESGANKEERTAAGLHFQGSSFIGMSDVGIKYWLGARKPLTWKDGTKEIDVKNVPVYWDVGVGVVYQAPINLDMFLEVGAGFQYSLQTTTEAAITYELGTFYVNALAELNYAFQPNLFLSIGVIAGYPLYVDGKITYLGFSWSGEESASGLYLAPYAGLSFSY